jgi:hypothetical protein
MAVETKVATLAAEAAMEEAVVVSFLLIVKSIILFLYSSLPNVHGSPGQFA